MILDALAAGKHVICEKPLTGFFGQPGQPDAGRTPKKEMYTQVLRDLEEIRQTAERSGRLVMYAENYIYATPVQRAAQLLRAKGSKAVAFLPENGDELIPSTFLVESLTPPVLAFFDGTDPVWKGLAFSLREVKPHA